MSTAVFVHLIALMSLVDTKTRAMPLLYYIDTTDLEQVISVWIPQDAPSSTLHHSGLMCGLQQPTHQPPCMQHISLIQAAVARPAAPPHTPQTGAEVHSMAVNGRPSPLPSRDGGGLSRCSVWAAAALHCRGFDEFEKPSANGLDRLFASGLGIT